MQKKILIIDDDSSFQIITKDALEKKGYTVRAASTGMEGIAAAQQDSPSLIILDIMMPLGHGLVTLDALREKKDTKSIPIIISTNLETAYAIVKDKNVQGFVLKSGDTSEGLVKKVKEVLE